ncbi:MAG TPA: sigma 54-interacting transcriptional regulator, partial [Candidatus Ozemobacteraceae bacterium]|nr:sigma 54-interacting transcriptional regulator [Candidatus Ozemobacteraceae bacterium]
GPFVAVNCSAISENLFESELFGHEKGSFTGALRTHKGRFERAHGGTLFLDEIGDIPTPFQAKLLRVLETGSIDRVGGEHPVQVDVRVIAATNRPLEEDARANRFRADLYYRISALQIHLPPLRERADDIPDLVRHFISQLNEKYQRRVAALTPEAVHLLQQYWWPGNVRELRNLMERLFAENQADVIGLRSLKDWYEERVQAVRHGVAYDPRVTSLPYQQPIPLGMELQQSTSPVGVFNSPTGSSAPGTAGLTGYRPSSNSTASAHETLLRPNEENWVTDRAQPIQAASVNGTRPPLNGGSTPPVELTEEQVRQAVQASGGNMTQAARRLGVHKATLYRFLKAHNLTRDTL